jgi:branched-chain amino acid transport system ATP-binding protein
MTTDATAPTFEPHRPLLRLESVTVAFGGLLALRDVDLEVRSGERLAILGPNGAGKTTLFNAVAGDIAPTSGRVIIAGVDCTMLPSRMRPKLGVARTYQKTRLFPGLTVEDNLYLAQSGKQRRHLSLWSSQRDADLRITAREAARRVWLADRVDHVVGDLSHGQQRQLEIGMALVTEPSLIMLDEPASGLSRGERERLVELLEILPRSTTLLLIEHDMDVALRVADRVVVMADGCKVAAGSPEQIRNDPMVHSIYLGESGQPQDGPRE